MTEKINNISHNIHYRLSVQVSLTGLSFLVTNLETSDSDFFSEKRFTSSRTPEELLLEIETVISETEALQPNFKEVSVVYATNVYTIVPASLFEASKASEYLKFNSKILTNDFITYDTLENFDIVVVYVPFVNINNYFFEQYGSFQYFHGASVFLKKVLNSEKYSIITKMYIHVQEEQFDCVIIKNGSLQLCNNYSYKTPEDFIYYVLFCLEQLKLNPEVLPVFLCGDIDKSDSNYEILYTYVRNLAFLEDPFSINTKETPEESHKKFLIKNIL